MERLDVTFPSGDATCAAWHYSPELVGPTTPTGPGGRPVVVMAHGLGGVKEGRLDAFAERFVAAGYAALVFDYRHFGGSGGEPRHLLDLRRQEEDWRAAVAHARTLPGVDPDRIIVWGTSLSGGHVLVTAAADPRIVAAIAQCPFTDGWASLWTLSVTTQIALVGRGLVDLLGSVLGRRPRLVRAAGAPGTAALMNAPDALDGYRVIQRAAGISEDVEVAARVALRIPFHFPGRRAAAIRCPVLFAICDDDTVAPAAATRRHAERAPRGTIRSYPVGHFDIYEGEWFETVVADELDFLRHHVPVAR